MFRLNPWLTRFSLLVRHFNDPTSKTNDILPFLLGDVDSADNEEETDSELHVHPNHCTRPISYGIENGIVQPIDSNPHNLQSSLSCGVMRTNHLSRIKVRPETQL